LVGSEKPEGGDEICVKTVLYITGHDEEGDGSAKANDDKGSSAEVEKA